MVVVLLNIELNFSLDTAVFELLQEKDNLF